MSCPFSFGEVNIPSFSAFWEGDDEDLENLKPAEKLRLKYESGAEEPPLPSDLFVIIEGPKISDFASKALLGSDKIKHICGIPSKNSSLYINEGKNQLLAVIEDDLNNSGEVTELLIPYAELAKEVVTVTLVPKVEYKSVEIEKYRNEIAIVRGIGANKKCVVELEAPNMIAGVGAGVATWRDNTKKSVSSYVIYLDKLPVDSISSQPVLTVLQKLGVSCSTSYTPVHKDESYLYM